MDVGRIDNVAQTNEPQEADRMMKQIGLAVTLALCLPLLSLAQSGDFMIFPQVADGRFADGSFFRTTISVFHRFGDGVTCNLTLYGMDANFGTGRTTSFSIIVPDDGFVTFRTDATGSIQTGYTTLTCSTSVNAQLTYASYNPFGTKTAEATVFPTTFESSSSEILVDGRDSAQLAIAIANNTDLQRTYNLTLKDETGQTVNTGAVTVPARSNLAQFINAVLSPPPASGQVFLLEVRSSDFSRFSMIGLQFTGSVFTTIPAN